MMHIDYKARNVELTDDLRTYTEEKMEGIGKLLQHVPEENLRAEIEFSRKSTQQSGDVFRADITIHAPRERTHAVGHGESLNAALDDAQEDVIRRLRREKGKRTDLFRHGAARIKKMVRFWE